jgi:uroporphyrinogen-III synthase
MSRASPVPLSGWYVISLRPPGQHEPIRRAAAALGARCFALATLQLQPLPAATALTRALACARVIVTSPAAARFAAATQALRGRRGQQWFALGPGTAAVLRRAGVDRVRTPAPAQDSEALLALPEFRELDGQAIGLLTAPGGRDLIAPELRRRGARVQRADLYQRRVRVVPDARKRALFALPGAQTALLVSSGEAFAALWQACSPEERAKLRHLHAVTSSARLQTLLQAHGFNQPWRAAGPQPAALVAAVREHAAAAFR